MSDVPSTPEGVGEILQGVRQAGAEYALREEFFNPDTTRVESIIIATKIASGDKRPASKIIGEIRDDEEKLFDAGFFGREYARLDQVLFTIGAYALEGMETPPATGLEDRTAS